MYLPLKALTLSIFLTASLSGAQDFATQIIKITPTLGITAQDGKPIVDSYQVQLNPVVFEAREIQDLNEASRLVWNQLVSCSGTESQAKVNYLNNQICGQAKAELRQLKEKVEVYLASSNAFGSIFKIECLKSTTPYNCESAMNDLRLEYLNQNVLVYTHQMFFEKMKSLEIHPFFNQLMMENIAGDQKLYFGERICNSLLSFCLDSNASWVRKKLFDQITSQYVTVSLDNTMDEAYRKSQLIYLVGVMKRAGFSHQSGLSENEDEIIAGYRKSLMAYRILSLTLAGKAPCSDWTLFPEQAWNFLRLASMKSLMTTYEAKLVEYQIQRACGYQIQSNSSYNPINLPIFQLYERSSVTTSEQAQVVQKSVEFWSRLKKVN